MSCQRKKQKNLSSCFAVQSTAIAASQNRWPEPWQDSVKTRNSSAEEKNAAFQSKRIPL
jgi:hypothetical protein